MRIIVNVDDFGLTRDTLAASIAAIEAGDATSATLMAGAPAAEEAAEFARSAGHASFGVHLTFGGEGSGAPLAPASAVPTLVGRDGRLRANTNAVRLAAVLGRLSVPEIAREVAAQVEWVRSRGVDVSHVDSHQHLHKFGPFRAALAQVLPALGIERVRRVQDVYPAKPLVSPTTWLGERWAADLRRHFVTTDRFYMPATTGDRSWTWLLDRPWADDETVEIGIHPGADEEWRRREAEGAAEFGAAARARGVSLIGWADV